MAKKHTHMYHKIQQKYGAGIWACALPNCTHYLPLNVSDMIYGRESLCTNCMDVMILDEERLKNNEPICMNCVLAKQGIFVESEEESPLDKLRKRAQENSRKQEKDEVEVIEPDEEHAPDCGIYDGGECDCT